jgi:nucleotide-binding universal stress UspA family protein
MNERDLLNAPRTYALLRTLAAAHVDVSPGSGLHTALMDFARIEATKAADVVAEFQRANPSTIRVETTEEAQRLIDAVRSEERDEIVRLRCALEGARDWAARSGASGLEQWCSEALSPTGALAVFPPADPPMPDPKDATIKALADVLEAIREHGRNARWIDGVFRDLPAEAAAALRLAGRTP